MAQEKILTIKTFKSNSFLSLKGGIFNANKFLVQFDLPKIINDLFDDETPIIDTLQHNVLKVQSPGFNISEKENEIDHQAQDKRQIGELQITFLESNDIQIKKLFYTYINKMIPNTKAHQDIAREYIDDMYAL